MFHYLQRVRVYIGCVITYCVVAENGDTHNSYVRNIDAWTHTPSLTA